MGGSNTFIPALFEQVTHDEKEFLSGCLIEDNAPSAAFEDLLVQFYKKQWKLTVHDVKLKVNEAQEKGEGATITHLLTDMNELKKKMLRRGIQ